MRTVLCLVFLLLVGCSDALEQKAKESVTAKKYHKAFLLYKQAITNKPTKDILYKELQKTVSFILHQGIDEIKIKDYQKAVNTLSLVAKDKDYPSVDAKVALGIAYLNSYKLSSKNIFYGLSLFTEALNQSKMRMLTKGIHKDILAWVVDKGMSRKDILYKNFQKLYDIGTVYRQFLFYDIIKNITQEQNIPRPKYLAEEKDKRILDIHSLLVWCLHNLKIISSESKFNAPASTAWSILRGYGTLEEINVCFVFLCRQLGLPCYLVQKDKSLFPVVKVDSDWIFVDFLDQNFVVDNGNFKFTLPKGLKHIDALRSGKILLVFPPRSIVPRMSTIENLYKLYHIDSPVFYYDINENASTVYKGLGMEFALSNPTLLITDSEKLSVQIYSKCIEVWGKYNHNKDEKLIEKWQKKMPIDIPTRQMVLHSLLKEKKYVEESVDKIENPEEFLVYYRAWSLKNIGEFEQSKSAFLAYIDKYSKGFWYEMAKVHLGQISFWQGKKDHNYYQNTFLKNSYFAK
ncbi:hypothetical protein [Candidatus Uabimicrobium sp. HlEnr_7]|uniref:hypothetical protein n=1 Tax=Candidatus Uabimicrobium helgolandensis TaxID=3095367 RepID=UPI003556FADA